jgi:two-component system NarL family sensor kinase
VRLGAYPHPDGPLRPHHGAVRSRPYAWALLALAGLLAIVAVIAGAVQGMPAAQVVGSYLLTNAAMGVAFAACGGILAVQRGRNPIGWLLLAAGVAHLLTAASGALATYGLPRGWPEPVLRVLASLFMLGWPWGICLLLPLALQLFPDGRPVSPRWRWLLVVTVVAGVAFVFDSTAEPAPIEIGTLRVASYLGLPF